MRDCEKATLTFVLRARDNLTASFARSRPRSVLKRSRDVNIRELPDFLSLEKFRDCETHITTKKTRLRHVKFQPV